ncbi:hypothetical protein [Cytobacillus praedii]|uniref:hypothetical protein n=1 Tax=Cytobacillus praedii TaxID=1742358 RepID=UPI002E1ADAE4|nr:hypothetical protein [Cytobacillus praedii]
MDQMERLRDIYGLLYRASEREADRIKMAVNYLQDNKLISREVGAEVSDKAEEMRILRTDHFKAIKEEKDAEAKKAHEEIGAKVQAWKDKWYKELENE